MTSILRKNLCLLFVTAISIVSPGCSLINPTPEVEAPPPPMDFSSAELQAIVLPQHLAQAQLVPLPEPQLVEDLHASEYYVHRIKYSGETLMAIARWYTGDGNNWKKLLQVNDGLNPLRMRLGLEVRIPQELLITRKPMPKSALSVRRAQTERPAPTTPKPQHPAADPQLFGPIDNSSSKHIGEDTKLPQPLQQLDE